MKNLINILIFIVFSTLFVQAQENSLKEQALDEFKKEHYNEAISLLEKAAVKTPNDPEIYYYLGWFNHYRAYDSRPLKGYDFAYSQKIFDYLDKAIRLNPQYGDAKYFYGAECSGNAFIAMQNYDVEKLRYFYKKAYEKGAYPAWLIEFGKNLMNTCDKNAILFTGGNPDFDVCAYLQLHQNYRTDITIIPLGNIDRPWYVKFLREGLEGGVRKININLTDQQIMDIHPFKWDITDVYIPVSKELKTKFKLNSDFQFKWTIEPDLFSNRMHSKIESEKAKKRTYLSPQRAILLQIVEDNFNERPIYFSNLAEPIFYGGLNTYFKNCGLTSQLAPIETMNTDKSSDVAKLEILLNPENFKDLPSLKTNDMPRISGLIFSYHKAFVLLAQYYKKNNQTEKLNKLVDTYKTSIAIGIDKEQEEEILRQALK